LKTTEDKKVRKEVIAYNAEWDTLQKKEVVKIYWIVANVVSRYVSSLSSLRRSLALDLLRPDL